MEIAVFHCQRCTNCCKNLFKEQEKSFGLTLFDFEAEILKKKAKKEKISLSLKPVNFIADKVSKKAIVLLWNIENKECPFLDKKQCIIYENRPLVCRAFPVVSTGIHGNRPMIRSVLCPQEIGFSGLGEKDKLSVALKKLMQRYGENFLSCYLLEKIEENEKNVMEILIKEEKIRPRKEKKGFRLIGLMEYFRKNEISDENYEKGLAEEIKTLSKTKDGIKQLSSMADKMEREFVKK